MPETATDVDDEGDETQNILEWSYKGKKCKVVRHDMGHYCGYVRTSFSDDFTYSDFHHFENNLVSVHGGLTYGVDEDGWVGFDCAHAGDKCVDEDGNDFGRMESYNTTTVWAPEDVRDEVESLAEQVRVVEEFADKVKNGY